MTTAFVNYIKNLTLKGDLIIYRKMRNLFNDT